MVGVRGFEPPASASRTQRSSQTEPHARAQPAASRSASDGTPPKSECLAEIAHAAGEFKAGRGNPHIFAGCKNEEQKEKATAGKSYLPKQSLAFCRGLPLEKTAKKNGRGERI